MSRKITPLINPYPIHELQFDPDIAQKASHLPNALDEYKSSRFILNLS